MRKQSALYGKQERKDKMGVFVDTGNTGFAEIRNGKYVDKSGMIDEVNRMIGTPHRLLCLSRPRRFGKSYAAQMLCAYYDRSCDSRSLFADLEISRKSNWEEHLNHYDVIYIDMTYVKPFCHDYTEVVSYLTASITAELKERYPELQEETDLPGTLIRAMSSPSISTTRFLFAIST